MKKRLLSLVLAFAILLGGFAVGSSVVYGQEYDCESAACVVEYDRNLGRAPFPPAYPKPGRGRG